MKKIKPVLRYPGSKFRKIDDIINILNIKKEDVFLDMFGGSGIVGVNVKQLIGCDVIINDFDKNFPIKDSTALQNMLSFQGMGKSFTKGALEYFNRRVENGYWDKLKIYNDILGQCEILNNDWLMIWKNGVRCAINKIYVDPPYDDIRGLYKESFNKKDHEELKKVLETNFNKYNTTDKKILISYNDTPFIRELYKDWNINEVEFQYQIGKLGNNNKKKKVKELFITNFKIKE